MKPALKCLVLFVIMSSLVFSGCKYGRPAGKSGPGESQTVAMADIAFVDMEGKKVALSLLAKDKPIYLTFFASWCKSCSREVKDVNRIFHEYSVQGLAVYGVNVGDSKKILNSFISKFGIDYPVLSDPDGKTCTEKLNLMGLPLNLVFDRNGKLIYREVVPPGAAVLKMALEANK